MDAETLQSFLDETPFHAHLGPLRIAISDDGIEITADLPASAANDPDGGVAHGGATATLLDTALSFALIARTGGDWSTADLRVDYLRPLALGPVRVTGRVVRAGNRLGRAD